MAPIHKISSARIANRSTIRLRLTKTTNVVVRPQQTIFVDLDETLIHSVWGKGRNPGKRTVIQLGDETYHSFLRPTALWFLEQLRALGSVRMLTSATRSYAIAHNNAFGLGFQPDEITAREDYTVEVQGAYGAKETYLLNEGQFPDAVIIDDLTVEDKPLKLKLRWLGKGAKHIPIQAFNGKDHAEFEVKLQKILELLKQS